MTETSSSSSRGTTKRGLSTLNGAGTSKSPTASSEGPIEIFASRGGGTSEAHAASGGGSSGNHAASKVGTS